MNLLGHAYLSFKHPKILLGNLISDFVKGNKQYDFPSDIQKGIQLHRKIDQFIDELPATHLGKLIFKPSVGLYAGAFLDIVYDHFLCLDNSIMDEQGWLAFTQEVYAQLQLQQEFLPPKFANMFPKMQTENWLYNYRYTWAIEKSFAELVKRAKYLDKSVNPFGIFEQNIPLLQACYSNSFPTVKEFAEKELQAL